MSHIKYITINEIVKIRSQSNYLEEHLIDNEIISLRTSFVNRRAISATYERRYLHIQNLEGFDNTQNQIEIFLKNIEAVTEEEISLIEVITNNDNFIIFCDSKRENLFGIIETPE